MAPLRDVGLGEPDEGCAAASQSERCVRVSWRIAACRMSKRVATSEGSARRKCSDRGTAAWRLGEGLAADHAARDASPTAAKRRRVIRMIVAAGMDHYGTIDYIRKLQSRRQHGAVGATVRCHV